MLCESTRIVVLVNGSSVGKLANRNERLTFGRIHLAHIATPAKAVVTLTALWSVRDKHSVAGPNSLYRDTDCLDNPDAAMAQNARRNRAARTTSPHLA